jgi:hypothetical protein
MSAAKITENTIDLINRSLNMATSRILCFRLAPHTARTAQGFRERHFEIFLLKGLL